MSGKYTDLQKGCVKFDLICLAFVLVQMGNGDFSRTIADLQARVEENVEKHISYKFAKLCISKLNPDEDLDVILERATEISLSNGLRIPRF